MTTPNTVLKELIEYAQKKHDEWLHNDYDGRVPADLLADIVHHVASVVSEAMVGPKPTRTGDDLDDRAWEQEYSLLNHRRDTILGEQLRKRKELLGDNKEGLSEAEKELN